MMRPPKDLETVSSAERARVTEMMDRILPVRPRRLGLLNDAAITSSLPRYPLESITAPTLAISVADDQFGTFAGARYSAEHIPDARFVGYATGGHIWAGHQEELVREIVVFLKGQLGPADPLAASEVTATRNALTDSNRLAAPTTQPF
jgi:2-hydroxy-6-oxonona-2,4-dienedioate hydrolase